MRVKCLIFMILLLLISGCSKTTKYKRIMPIYLELTQNINEEMLKKSGNYAELSFDKADKPFEGIVYWDNKKLGYLKFDNYGRLVSMNMKREEDVYKIKAQYIYSGDRLYQFRTFTNSTLAFEQTFCYDSNGIISEVKNMMNTIIIPGGEVSSTRRYSVEVEYHEDYINEIFHDDVNTRRITYFAKNENKVTYYDPIFSALYRPFREKNMEVYKYETFENGKIKRVVEYDNFGNIQKESNN